MTHDGYWVPTSASPWKICDTIDDIGTWTWECPPEVAIIGTVIQVGRANVA